MKRLHMEMGWQQEGQEGKKGRLDYCLITPDLTEQLINVQHQFTSSTDHASIIIEIGTEEE